MARNGSGTYAVPVTFTANTTASAADVNAVIADLGSEMTNSLPRDGQAGMTGQLKAANGTSGAPGYSFSSDINTGFYRAGADEIGVSCGGTLAARFTADGIVDAAGATVSGFPSGTKMLFVQTAAPTGWTKETTHDNKALRIVSGAAGAGGSAAFTSVFGARTIEVTNLPPHAHGAGTISVTISNEPLSFTLSFGGNTPGATSGPTGFPGTQNLTVNIAAHKHDATVSGNTASTGSGTAMDFAVAYVDVIIAAKD